MTAFSQAHVACRGVRQNAHGLTVVDLTQGKAGVADPPGSAAPPHSGSNDLPHHFRPHTLHSAPPRALTKAKWTERSHSHSKGGDRCISCLQPYLNLCPPSTNDNITAQYSSGAALRPGTVARGRQGVKNRCRMVSSKNDTGPPSSVGTRILRP